MAEQQKGFVVAVDGPDGVGKTTQVNLLAEYLDSNGKKVFKTRSSGGTVIGEELRKVSLSQVERSAETDFYITLAMATANAEEIAKRKSADEFVVIDRSPLAWIAYNGYGSEHKDKQFVIDESMKWFERWQIDLLIFLGAPEEVIKQRRQNRGTKDYFESKGPDYHERVMEGYQVGLDSLLEQAEKVNVIELDASGSTEELQRKIMSLLNKQLN